MKKSLVFIISIFTLILAWGALQAAPNSAKQGCCSMSKSACPMMRGASTTASGHATHRVVSSKANACCTNSKGCKSCSVKCQKASSQKCCSMGASASRAASVSGADPICRMKISAGHASGGTSVYRGKTFAFCSKACKTTFDKDPAKYAK